MKPSDKNISVKKEYSQQLRNGFARNFLYLENLLSNDSKKINTRLDATNKQATLNNP